MPDGPGTEDSTEDSAILFAWPTELVFQLQLRGGDLPADLYLSADRSKEPRESTHEDIRRRATHDDRR